MEAEMEKVLKDHFGAGYAEPKKVTVGTLYFEDHAPIIDLMKALSDFFKEHPNCTITQKDWDAPDNGHIYFCGYDAERMETPEEMETRVTECLRYAEDTIEKRWVQRRDAYQRLKREFGGPE